MRRGVQIRSVLFPDGVPVIGDAIVLQQVLLNLVNNGMDATEHLSGPKVLTLTTATPLGSNYGTISVEDNGCGIAEEHKAKLYKPFFTTKNDGLGMGLSISRSLIESLGGHITLVNRAEPGTVFEEELPLILPKGTAKATHA